MRMFLFRQETGDPKICPNLRDPAGGSGFRDFGFKGLGFWHFIQGFRV